jgi:hypothetical protein
VELNLRINGQSRKFQVVTLSCSKAPGSHLEHELAARVIEQSETEIVPPYEEKLAILYRGSYRMATFLRLIIEENGGIKSPEVFQEYINSVSSEKNKEMEEFGC